MKKFYHESIKDALRNIGHPVAYLVYAGDKPTFIVYYSYRTHPLVYADNKPVLENCFCTVEVCSEDGEICVELADEARGRLISGGWRVTDEVDDYDNDVGIYRTIIDINYTGSV